MPMPLIIRTPVSPWDTTHSLSTTIAPPVYPNVGFATCSGTICGAEATGFNQRYSRGDQKDSMDKPPVWRSEVLPVTGHLMPVVDHVLSFSQPAARLAEI